MKLGVPFGQDKTTGEWKDVAEVERGLACGCICPSCHLPLSAHQGDEREWHFTHHTRNTPKVEIVDCEFSFEVSVRMMIHQLLREGASLKLPAYFKPVSVPKVLREQFPPEVMVFKELELKGSAGVKLTVDADFCGHKVDALYEFNKASLVIYLEYRGRKCQLEKLSLQELNTGVATLNIDALSTFFYHQPMVETGKLGTARAQLLGWLQTSIKAKDWYYHPREKACIAKRDEDINKALKEPTTGSHVLPIPAHQQLKCQCLGCGKMFMGIRNKVNPCPDCQTHLYVTDR